MRSRIFHIHALDERELPKLQAKYLNWKLASLVAEPEPGVPYVKTVLVAEVDVDYSHNQLT